MNIKKIRKPERIVNNIGAIRKGNEKEMLFCFPFGMANKIRDIILNNIDIIKTNFAFNPSEQFNQADTNDLIFYFERDTYGNVTQLKVSKK